MRNKVIFVDFDGTITKEDTCNAMVKAFASDGWKEIGRLWEENQLTTVECANKLFELMDADLEDIGRLLDSIGIDGCFKAFLSFCEAKAYKVYILSDGYDFNIDRILKKHGIDLPFYSNRLSYGDGFRIECPYHNAACGLCGTCKKSLIARLKKAGQQVVYIGDGRSDTCAAMDADLIFAKGALYRFCVQEKVAAVEFEDFGDILDSGLL